MKSIIITSLFFLILVSCETESKRVIDKTTFTKTLKRTDSYSITLDSVSIQNSGHFQYVEILDQTYLAMFNKPDNSIKVYDYENGTLYHSINLLTEGPNAIIDLDGSPSNFKIIDTSSVIVHSIAQEKIFQINWNGVIKDSWEIPLASSGPKHPLVDLQTLCQLQDFDGHMIITARAPWYKDGKPPIIVIDKEKKSEIRYIPVEFPLYTNYDLNEIGNWNFFKASNTRMDDGTTLINYPLDHNVLLIKPDLTVKVLNLEDPNLQSLRPFGKRMNQENSNSQDYFEYQGTAPVYHAILYDKYNSIIYRISRLEFPMTELRKIQNGGQRRSWDFSIMIYDQSFNPIGEKLIINSLALDMNSIFVSNQGLHIRRKDTEEDLLQFDVYKLINK